MTYDLNVRCSSCSRFIKMKAKASSEVVIVCEDRKCKAENTIKVVMLSDMYRQANIVHEHEAVDNKADEYKERILELEAKVADLDGRTKEAKKLKAELEEANDYIEKLEAL